MVAVTRLAPEHYVRVPWKNGGGESVTIAGERLPGAAPGDWSAAIWQLGRTAIVKPGPFSDLTGFERLQTVVRGEGLMLDTPSGTIDLSRPFAVARYDGGTPIMSRLRQGPVEVVNLIARRDRATIAMRVLAPPDILDSGDGFHVAYAPADTVRLTIEDETIDISPDHGLSFSGPARIRCNRGRVVLATVLCNPPS